MNLTIQLWGALAFGVVVGYVSYRTLRRTQATGLGDIATVIGAVGGGAITALFPAGGTAFGAYGIGLAVGFFVYLLIAVIIAKKTTGLTAVHEFLGEPQVPVSARPGAPTPSRSVPSVPPGIPG